METRDLVGVFLPIEKYQELLEFKRIAVENPQSLIKIESVYWEMSGGIENVTFHTKDETIKKLAHNLEKTAEKLNAIKGYIWDKRIDMHGASSLKQIVKAKQTEIFNDIERLYQG